MRDIGLVKRNVAKMVSMQAPEEDIDGYISSEGYTVEDIRNFKPEVVAPIGTTPKKSSILTSGATAIGDKIKNNLSEISGTGAQIAGGIMGSMVGGLKGGAIGAGAGRLASDVADIYDAKPSGFVGVGANINKTKELVDKLPSLAGRAFTAGVADYLGSGAIKLLGKGVSSLGSGVVENLLGKRVAEVGRERGYEKLLAYGKGMPEEMKKKMINFFPNLKRTLGGKVQEAVYSPQNRKISIALGDLKKEINEFIETSLGKGTTVYDLDVSPAQAKFMEEETMKILSMRGMTRKLPFLWEYRKALDERIFRRNLSPDAKRYMRGLRSILNKYIKSSGDDTVSQSFKRYSEAMDIEDHLGATFDSIKQIDGKAVSPKLEAFASNLLKPNKDELIALLKNTDTFQNADDQVINDFIDYAASEALEKDAPLGFFRTIIYGTLGGGRRIAEIAAKTQTKGFKTAAKAISQVPRITSAAALEAAGG